jgi:predicted membrane protein (TIGR00267 family)
MDFPALRRKYAFPLITGLTDGILTALTLGAGKVFEAHDPIDSSLTFRLAAGASLSAAFVFFVADYARLRLDLVHAEQHLTLHSHGGLATTHLGRAIIFDALRGTVLSGLSSFLGVVFPLIFAVFWPAVPWIALLVSLAALAFLGAGLGRSLYGSAPRWAVSLVIIGAVLAFIGLKLHIL